MSRKVRAAAVQLSPVLFSREGTTSKVCDKIAEAAAQGAELVVFPETVVPYYPYFSFIKAPAVIGAEHLLLLEQAVTLPGPSADAIAQAARKAGRPVVVATQMLESMITSPTPTRAEVSDVANAVYDGADAVMLSAESAAGAWPVEAVRMMDAIAGAVETDPEHARRVHFTETLLEPTTADALSSAAGQIAGTISARAVCCFTTSGSTARRASRERINVPLLVLTPKLATARQLGLLWGVHAVHTRDVGDFEEMVNKAKRMALRAGVAGSGDRIIIMAGVPFGTPGSTNVLHIARLTGDELKGRK